MKERPVLFSAPMVRALLADRKTQTRRIVKPLRTTPGLPASDGWTFAMDGQGFGGLSKRENGGLSGWPLPRSPYGVPGDRLWVKETWHPSARIGADIVEIEYLADESTRELAPPSDFMWERWDDKWIRGGWRPSLFMSRWMSRITLEVTEVRVQRVQDISEEDAKAEGVTPLQNIGADQPIIGEVSGRTHGTHPHVLAFAVLWDKINGDRSGCNWMANPWCWCISFRRIPDGVK